MSKKIMIIEDEQDILTLYKDFLSKKGYFVVASSTFAEKAVDDYLNLKPDIVLLDYKLPGKNGLEASKEILKEDGEAKILILTAHENVMSEFESESSFQNKNIFVLMKPIKLSKLNDIISKMYIA